MLNRLKKYAAALLGFVLLCTAGSAAAQMPERINITYVKSPFNLQNMVMKERGLLEAAFEKEGTRIEWRNITSGAQQAQGLAAGNLDVSSVMNTASLLLGASNGVPLKVINGVSHPHGIFAVVGKAGEHFSVKDLKGRTIAGPKGTVLHQLLVAALRDAGLAPSDVRLVSMDPASALSALLSGNADAALLAANLITKARTAGCEVIAEARGHIRPNLVMVARSPFMKAYPEAVARIVAVQRETLAWIGTHKDEALEIAMRVQGISREEAEALYEGSRFYDFLTEDDTRGMREDQRFLIENGLMAHEVNVGDLIDPMALQK